MWLFSVSSLLFTLQQALQCGKPDKYNVVGKLIALFKTEAVPLMPWCHLLLRYLYFKGATLEHLENGLQAL